METSSLILDRISEMLGGFDLGYIFLFMLLLIIIMLILFIQQMKHIKNLQQRLENFLTGKDGSSLEQEITALFEDNKFIKNSTAKNQRDISKLFKNMEKTYQKMGLVKYDAFNQMGGQLSFSLALLDENNNGFIINSVHSVEGCYSYTKEIKRGESSIELGKEEAEALSIAMQ